MIIFYLFLTNKRHNAPKQTHFIRETKHFLKADVNLDCLNVDLDSEKFFFEINTIIDKYMPVRKLKAKQCRQQLKLWITPTIIATINKKNKLWKKLVESNSRQTRLKFNRIKNEITAVNSETKENRKKN